MTILDCCLCVHTAFSLFLVFSHVHFSIFCLCIVLFILSGMKTKSNEAHGIFLIIHIRMHICTGKKVDTNKTRFFFYTYMHIHSHSYIHQTCSHTQANMYVCAYRPKHCEIGNTSTPSSWANNKYYSLHGIGTCNTPSNRINVRRAHIHTYIQTHRRFSYRSVSGQSILVCFGNYFCFCSQQWTSTQTRPLSFVVRFCFVVKSVRHLSTHLLGVLCVVFLFRCAFFSSNSTYFSFIVCVCFC